MRASFVFSEVLTGLRRNMTMTIAMVITTAISLGLLGGGLLVVRTIDRMQDLYYDRVEVAVFLTEDISANDPGCTTSPCTDLRTELEAASGVESVTFESREEASPGSSRSSRRSPSCGNSPGRRRCPPRSGYS